MALTDQKKRKVADITPPALKQIARRFKLHLRMAREMYRDGYLKTYQNIPEFVVNEMRYSPIRTEVLCLSSYYRISPSKLIAIYNNGYLDLIGLDYVKEISRYMQRKNGQLSVRLLCYLAYDRVRSGGSLVRDQRAHQYFCALKVDGKLSPPRELDPYLDQACRGQSGALERVARWMRDLIDSVGKPYSWTFYGVRLALVEGKYSVCTRTVPRLRRLKRLRRLAHLLRNHPLLHGYVTPVAEPGSNGDYYYVYHRPGEFWDL